MGSPPTDFPEIRLHGADDPLPPRAYVAPEVLPVAHRERLTRYIILFALTVVTTTMAGQMHYASFVLGFSAGPLNMSWWNLFVHGLWYSVPILAILGAHEFGHYFACRYYRVDASLPYFLPMPVLMTGTLGAVIRIRQPFPGKRALFDIGIAGPIAGFVVALPVLFIGMYLSRVIKFELPPDYQGYVINFGEPLLFQAAEWLTFGPIPDGYTVNMHPMVFAGWFGLFATALNLFPIGQLDGGHITYAVLGRKSTAVTLTTVLCLIGLSVFSMAWWLWTVVTVVMLLVFGPRHPRTWDEHVPLDAGRIGLALLAVLIFAICFTPAPMEELKQLVGG